MNEEVKQHVLYEENKQTFIESACDSEILSVIDYSCKIEDFPPTREIWLAFYSYGICQPNVSLWHKIQYAFSVLKYLWHNNTVYTDQIILNKEQAIKLRDTLTEIITKGD